MRHFLRKNKLMLFCAGLLMALLLSGCHKGPDKYELRENAIALYQQGNYEAALNAFNEALDASAGQVSDLQYDILKYRGECEIRLGRYVEAKKTYSALVELEKEGGDQERCAQLLRELGALDEIKEAAELFASGAYGDAYDAFSVYANLDGTLTGRAAVYNKAVCAEYMGRYDEALELLESYLNMYPDDAMAKKEADFCRSRV